MKICHFAATNGIGRGEAFIEIANEMASHIDTHLLVPNDSLFLNNISKDVTFTKYKSKRSRNNPLLLFEIFQYFKRNKFDLVHTHFGKATFIFKRMNRFLQLPHIATKHNPRPSVVFKNIKYVTVVSPKAIRSVGKKNSSVRVIRNGISAKSITPVFHSRPSTPFRILAIGRLDRIKGFDILINQLSKVKFKFILSIAGDGPERNRLESLAIKKLGKENFRFLGFRFDVENLLQKSDLVVSSSLSEGCPMVFVEALFFASLFISTPVGEASEVLPLKFLSKHNSLAEKINEMKENYSQMSYEYRLFSDKIKFEYSSTQMIQQYLKAYSDVISAVEW